MWEKLETLKLQLADMKSILVAYSGGIDSTFLLKVATDVLGERALGVMLISPLIPDYERTEAEAIAQAIPAPLKVLEKGELQNPDLLANTPNRCYVCKAAICVQLKAFAAANGYAVVVDGSNADDVGDYRPGQRAARECGMRSPLQEVGLTKAEIRSLARDMGLPNWNKPSSACLASRIPYGTPITSEALAQIGQAERLLRDLGVRQYRVRHHQTVARIEVPREDFETILTHREHIVEAMKALGYTYVTLDLSGFRSGSMNDVVDETVKESVVSHG